MGPKRRAFTLIELLVAIAIIAVLIGLLLPAVQLARETALRAKCKSNLQQIGLALHMYHDSKGSFPPGYTSYVNDHDSTGPGWSWAAHILPYLEQEQLFALIDFRVPLTDPSHAAVRTANVPYLRCPSDVRDDPIANATFVNNGGLAGDLARANYVACYGNTPFLGEAPGVLHNHLIIDGISGRGMFYRNSSVRMHDIGDGLSQTFMVGERSAANSISTWVGVIPGATWRSLNDDTYYGGIPSNLAASLVLGHACRQHPPSTPNGVAEDFSSKHKQGINVLFGDCSVHSVHASVNMASYPFTASIHDDKLILVDF